MHRASFAVTPSQFFSDPSLAVAVPLILGGSAKVARVLHLPALLRQHVQYANTGTCEIPLICFANAVRLEHVLRQLAAQKN